MSGEGGPSFRFGWNRIDLSGCVGRAAREAGHVVLREERIGGYLTRGSKRDDDYYDQMEGERIVA